MKVQLADTPATYARDLEKIEVDLLLEGIFRHYGFDFRSYAYSSLKRRLWKRIQAEGLDTVSELQDRVLHDPSILLEEEGLYDRSRIYATDINEVVLQTAKNGIYPVEKMQEYTQNYIRAGGTRSFSDYYVAKYDAAIFSSALTRNVVFSQHNLVTDRSFAEFNVILCRNVMIYFDRKLQDRVHSLFYESLVQLGFLGLGSKESLKFSKYENCYEEVDARDKIYRRVK